MHLVRITSRCIAEEHCTVNAVTDELGLCHLEFRNWQDGTLDPDTDFTLTMLYYNIACALVLSKTY